MRNSRWIPIPLTNDVRRHIMQVKTRVIKGARSTVPHQNLGVWCQSSRYVKAKLLSVKDEKLCRLTSFAFNENESQDMNKSSYQNSSIMMFVLLFSKSDRIHKPPHNKKLPCPSKSDRIHKPPHNKKLPCPSSSKQGGPYSCMFTYSANSGGF